MNKIGKIIKQERLKNKLTLQELSNLFNISVSNLSKIEDELKEMFDLKSIDYIISTSDKIWIRGKDIYCDTARLIDNLKFNE